MSSLKSKKSFQTLITSAPPANNGILLVDKQVGCSSFSLVSLLRKKTGVKKIGHAGTLDPFASGLMVMLIGREYTKKSDQFLNSDKEYIATLHLGITTDSFDCTGEKQELNERIPSSIEIEQAIERFQGEILQTPPMFSAKKVDGKRLYQLARQGITIERKQNKVHIQITYLSYDYPYLKIKVACSKGTYIRSLADDIGKNLGVGAHLASLQRTKSGAFLLENAIPQDKIKDPEFKLLKHIVI